MTPAEAEDFYRKMIEVQRVLGADEATWAAVAEAVDGFFARYPNLQRTERAEKLAVVMAFQRLAAAPAEAPQRKTA